MSHRRRGCSLSRSPTQRRWSWSMSHRRREQNHDQGHLEKGVDVEEAHVGDARPPSQVILVRQPSPPYQRSIQMQHRSDRLLCHQSDSDICWKPQGLSTLSLRSDVWRGELVAQVEGYILWPEKVAFHNFLDWLSPLYYLCHKNIWLK